MRGVGAQRGGNNVREFWQDFLQSQTVFNSESSGKSTSIWTCVAMRTYCVKGICWHAACGHALGTALGVCIESGVGIVFRKDERLAKKSFLAREAQSGTLYILYVFIEDLCTNCHKRYTR